MQKIFKLSNLFNKKLLYFAFLRIFGYNTKKLAIALHYYTPKKSLHKSKLDTTLNTSKPLIPKIDNSI